MKALWFLLLGLAFGVAGCVTVYDYATTNMDHPVFNTAVTITGEIQLPHLFSVKAPTKPTKKP